MMFDLRLRHSYAGGALWSTLQKQLMDLSTAAFVSASAALLAMKLEFCSGTPPYNENTLFDFVSTIGG